MRIIKLGRRESPVALVDDEDYLRVSQYNWYLDPRRGGQQYAIRKYYDGAGKQHKVYLHIEILGPSSGDVDHINGSGLDNTRKNLRRCTHAQNCANQRAKKSISGYKGVVLHRNRWDARLHTGGRCLYLGTFEKKLDAAVAYNHAAAMLFGEFANLNKVSIDESIVSARES